MYVERNIEERSCYHCCNGKSMSVCICSLMYPACNTHGPYCHLWPCPLDKLFPHYLTNGTIFGGKKNTEHKMGIFIFSTPLSEKFIILGRNERDMIKKYIGLHVKYHLFLSDLCET